MFTKGRKFSDTFPLGLSTNSFRLVRVPEPAGNSQVTKCVVEGISGRECSFFSRWNSRRAVHDLHKTIQKKTNDGKKHATKQTTKSYHT